MINGYKWISFDHLPFYSAQSWLLASLVYSLQPNYISGPLVANDAAIPSGEHLARVQPAAHSFQMGMASFA